MRIVVGLRSSWPNTARRVLLLVGSLALLAGCDPYKVPRDSDAIDVAVRVTNDGNGEVTLYPGVGRSDADIDRLAQSLDSAVFSGTAHDLRLGDNGGGYPLIHLETRGVYERARLTHVGFDTRGLCDELRSGGYVTVYIT
jgi:hypothetical protein